MTKQEQQTSGTSLAVQSGRDTVIRQGIGHNDMKQIIETLAAQIPAYAAIAREIVDARLKDFEERVLERFAEETSTRTEAFTDPDFQYLLGRAQHAYARAGDNRIRDTLVDLIAQRSKQNGRNRLALSLNEAVENSAVLTANEFAELSLVYLLKHTANKGIGNLDLLAQYMNRNVAPLLADISEEHASYSYLEAQACATISMGSVDLRGALIQNYGGVLARGFVGDALQSHLPEGKKSILDGSNLVIPCLNDPLKLQLRAVTRQQFHENAADVPLSETERNNLWSMFEGTMWSKDEIINNLSSRFPQVAELFRLWNDTPLKSLNLTSVGLAIGHANLVRVAGFSADLAIWIK